MLPVAQSRSVLSRADAPPARESRGRITDNRGIPPKKMAIRFIPEPARAGLEEVRKLTDDQVAELVAAADATDTNGEKTDTIFGAIDTASGGKGLARALRSLYSYRFSTESPVDQLAADVTNVMVSNTDDNLRLLAEEAQSFKEHLQALLSIDSLWQAVKADLLAREHASTFIYSKVVTDIRPVFGDEVSAPPRGAILSHNLHIHYVTKTGEHSDFVVGMGSDDLKDLQASLERAYEKIKSLTRLLKTADVHQIDLKGTE